MAHKDRARWLKYMRDYMRKRRLDPEFRAKEKAYLRAYFQNPRVRARIRAQYHSRA